VGAGDEGGDRNRFFSTVFQGHWICRAARAAVSRTQSLVGDPGRVRTSSAERLPRGAADAVTSSLAALLRLGDEVVRGGICSERTGMGSGVPAAPPSSTLPPATR
jgi:hypothetical protein